MLNAMRRLPFDRYTSGALNLDVQPKQFEGEKGHSAFSGLLAAYLNNGGLHAQVSSANVDELLDAQKCPQEHRDLTVRVTGYSGIFVDIDKKLQDDIIERMK
jgi:formate C-acetyltransferase